MDYPKRKHIRLYDYDYSSNGAYFITICTKNRECIFGNIYNDNGGVYCNLSDVGKIVDKSINDISKHYSNVQIPCYCIMPNHVHIALIVATEENGRQVAVPTIIGNMKRVVSMQIGKKIWQARFNDHVIRNEEEYIRICEYIDANPLLWENDAYFS